MLVERTAKARPCHELEGALGATSSVPTWTEAHRLRTSHANVADAAIDTE